MASYARVEVFLILILGGALSAATGYYLGWWCVAPVVLMAALLSFYRDPPRRIADDPAALLAPADGRVMSVERGWTAAGGGLAELRICIFLSVLDVHVNRAPCAGRVTAVDYSPGLFLNALKPEATLKNENNLVTLAPAAPIPGPVRVRQIAGLLAKRIVCALKTGDQIAAGQRYGMIKLGSQTEVRVPDDPRWEVLVRAGQHVSGGTTVLARIQSGG